MEATATTLYETPRPCLGLTDVFFGPPHRLVETAEERRVREAVAKGVCTTCPATVDCLEQALLTRTNDGIWGGLTPSERRDLSQDLRSRVGATW